MAKFHFLGDYEKHIKELKAQHPMDEAMSLAMGGGWDSIGNIGADLLIHCGLTDGMHVLDLGCGSGRIAATLCQKIQVSSFVGIDVIPDLLDYARTTCPPNYVFTLGRLLKVPTENNRFDFAYALNVFTHLPQLNVIRHLHDINKTLTPGGLFLFSFLEIGKHRPELESDATLALHNGRSSPHLNMYLSRSQVAESAEKLGFKVARYIEPNGARSALVRPSSY